MPVKLGDVAERMAQGIRTSANEIYVVDYVSEKTNVVSAFSKQLNKNVELNKSSLSLFLQGREIKRYQILPSGKMVIIPYQMEKGRAILNSQKVMKEDSLLTLAYLTENKMFLENREKGKMKGAEWYAYVYPKNIDLMKQSKILIPDIADRAQFAFDENGDYAFTSGYGITLKNNTGLSHKYVLGLLNSKLLEYYLKRVSTPMRGGFFRFFTQFMERIPIRAIDFTNPAEKSQHEKMVSLVTQMLELHKSKAGAKTQSETAVYERQIRAVDGQIDSLVYELYELTSDEIKIVEGK
ncbi:MAG: hypothetical protein HYZ24_14970 [Chloroflexi bacterium]|nr:hypothetical protein [Chloroflexota bacterium]